LVKEEVMRRTQREIDKAVKKVERAIDAMVDLQDDGWGCDTVTRVLEMLNSLRGTIESKGGDNV
jgi:hypothetical protein